jgi:para-aminobenzoate synthetase component I
MDRPLISFVNQLNAWGSNRVPFLFVIDFEMKKPMAFQLGDINAGELLYAFGSFTNSQYRENGHTDFSLTRYPVPLPEYAQRFRLVCDHLKYGDSFLTNLTLKTRVELPCSLTGLFSASRSMYKLWYKNEFLVFSPETFIQIRNNKIFSYPMKGTIDAGISNAAQIILNDQKEIAEHVTIVDLIRNDLSQVATNVRVSKFRYIEEIKTHHKNLLQVSSEIVGDLSSRYGSRLGDILIALLPAGSVSGAPKPKTLEIIRNAEQEDRGYYTGVFGYFDGVNLDSAVMIRYIERNEGHYYYRSGGGITTQSIMEMEYQEALDKIYVPVD